MTCPVEFDVFNGDADGLLAHHQFRLANPLPTEQVTLITGVKRDIALLDRVVATDRLARDGRVNVFDISYDRNATAVAALLQAGVRITYFDHHRAKLRQSHERLAAFIDESPDTCTSLLVDRHCGGAFHLWAIAAAFGDNLTSVARHLAETASLSPESTSLLQLLGECLNYNAYGETVTDLHYHPAELAARLEGYVDPFKFIGQEDVLTCLQSGRERDMAYAMAVDALHATAGVAVYQLPDEAWARRISGAFANHLVHAFPDRAHAVLSADAKGTNTVSIRAPANSPRDADKVASRFKHGGGRAIAAGIEAFPLERLSALVNALEDTYR